MQVCTEPELTVLWDCPALSSLYFIRLSDRHGNLHRQMLEFMRPETLSGGHDPSHVQHSLQAKYRGGLRCSSVHCVSCCHSLHVYWTQFLVYLCTVERLYKRHFK